jgi:hypothetical protein
VCCRIPEGTRPQLHISGLGRRHDQRGHLQTRACLCKRPHHIKPRIISNPSVQLSMFMFAGALPMPPDHDVETRCGQVEEEIRRTWAGRKRRCRGSGAGVNNEHHHASKAASTHVACASSPGETRSSCTVRARSRPSRGKRAVDQHHCAPGAERRCIQDMDAREWHGVAPGSAASAATSAGSIPTAIRRKSFSAHHTPELLSMRGHCWAWYRVAGKRGQKYVFIPMFRTRAETHNILKSTNANVSGI